jgi:hypothetical protein
VYLLTHPPFNNASNTAIGAVGTTAFAIQYTSPVSFMLIFRRYPDKVRMMLWAATFLSCGSMLLSSWATAVCCFTSLACQGQ